MLKQLNSNYSKSLERAKEKTSLYSQPLSDLLEKMSYAISNSTLQCCGITELDFQALNAWFKNGNDIPNKLSFKQLVAFMIDRWYCEDERVLIVGIPTRVGEYSSYHMEFYEKLRDVLNGFGFTELAKPYENANSGNEIVVLAALARQNT